MNADGTKLSKRQRDIKISSYRDKGIFPLALINFITHSGGGFTKDAERHLKPMCYSMEELIDQVCIQVDLWIFFTFKIIHFISHF